MKELFIHTEYIELQNALKLLRVISSGGSAKVYLSENSVLVNGESENRRGRKLYPEDKLIVDGEEVVIKNEH